MLSCCSISGICQNFPITTTEPSTLVPDSWLQNALKWIEKGKVDAELIKLMNEKIDLLTYRISLKDSLINICGQKDETNEKIKATYQSELKNLLEQRDLAVAEMKKQNKQYRRQKRKTLFVGIGGVVATSAVFIFLIK